MKLLLLILGGAMILAGMLLVPAVPDWLILSSCFAWLFGCFAVGASS